MAMFVMIELKNIYWCVYHNNHQIAPKYYEHFDINISEHKIEIPKNNLNNKLKTQNIFMWTLKNIMGKIRLCST